VTEEGVSLDKSMYHSGDNVGAIVADIGSFSTRIGHAGDDVPSAYFPSVTNASLCVLLTVLIAMVYEHIYVIVKYRLLG
jgi:hypothetical protein